MCCRGERLSERTNDNSSYKREDLPSASRREKPGGRKKTGVSTGTVRHLKIWKEPLLPPKASAIKKSPKEVERKPRRVRPTKESCSKEGKKVQKKKEGCKEKNTPTWGATSRKPGDLLAHGVGNTLPFERSHGGGGRKSSHGFHKATPESPRTSVGTCRAPRRTADMER